MKDQIINKWQNDILIALENGIIFNKEFWISSIEKGDINGVAFMQDIARSKPAYDYLNGLGLINRGFCPITEEPIDNSLEYAFYDRVIYLSKKGAELGMSRKSEIEKDLIDSNFQRNFEKTNSFLGNVNNNVKNTKYENFTFFIRILLSVFCAYTIIKPETTIGYVGLFLLNALLFTVFYLIEDWIREKL